MSKRMTTDDDSTGEGQVARRARPATMEISEHTKLLCAGKKQEIISCLLKRNQLFAGMKKVLG